MINSRPSTYIRIGGGYPSHYRRNYHRKYVFVSFGGYWPSYRHRRYYWYGAYPSSTYSYYYTGYPSGATYNNNNYYYNTTNKNTSVSGGYPEPDYDYFAKIREKNAQQEETLPPADESMADRYFDEAVEKFAEGDYVIASARLKRAVELSDDDMILPFAYSQALFANGDYGEAAAVLREAIDNTAETRQSVYFPRGLYPSDEVLDKQVAAFVEEAENSYDGDMQLLLGWQLMGVGDRSAARDALDQAREDYVNADAANALLAILDKIEIQD